MLNHHKCVDCKEPTKYSAGFWDGQDPKTGKPTSGLIYNCDNIDCSLKQRHKAMYEEAEAQREFSRQANESNRVDIALLEQKRKGALITISRMSAVLEISPVVYSDYKAERFPMPKELYDKALELIATREDAMSQMHHAMTGE